MSAPQCPHQFSQAKPYLCCRNARNILDKCRTLVSAGRIDYIFKCRNPRCSRECHKAWARKHAAVLNRLLDVHVDMPKYRGCLKLRKDATPDEHKRAKRAFLQTMRRWSERTGHTFQVHATMDITSPTDAHWDCVAYSNAPVTPLKRAVSAAWSRAGGRHQSLMPLDDDEIAAQCRYAANDIAPDRERGRRYLPATRPHGEPGGINLQWYSAGFWKGHKVADLWREVIEQWMAEGVFGETASNTDITTLASTDVPDDVPETTLGTPRSGVTCEGESEAKVVISVLETDPPKPSLADRIRAANPWLDEPRKPAPKRDDVTVLALLAEIDRRIERLPLRDAANIMHVLPMSPDDAVTAAEIAAMMGTDTLLVQYRLKSCPQARRLPGSPLRYYGPSVPERVERRPGNSIRVSPAAAAC